MKTKAIITAVLLTSTSMAWANGGKSIDTVDVNNVEPTQAEVTPIMPQGPVNQFSQESADQYDSVIVTDYTFDTSA